MNDARPIGGDAPCQPPTRSNRLIYLLWIVGAAAALWLAWSGAHPIPIADRDFTSLWVAGKMAAAGRARDIYDLDALRAAATVYAGTTKKIAFPYPPHSLLVAVPLSFLPLTISFVVWQLVSGLLFYVVARPYLPADMPRGLAVLTPAAFVNVIFGQNGLFLGALWLFAFSGSTLAAAALSIKPQVGLLVAFEMLRRKLVLRTALIAFGLVTLSIVAFGFTAWQASVPGAAAGQFKIIAAGGCANCLVQMTTPFVGYGYVGWLSFALAAAVLLARQWGVFAGATATFLISPYGFHYDMTVVCLGFGILLFERWRTLPTWQVFVCALAFLSPVLVRAGTWLVPPILLLGLHAQTTVPPRRSCSYRAISGAD